MEAILMRAGSFMAVIILGYVLKKVGFFKEEDFYVMSKIMVKITLPASIIVNGAIHVFTMPVRFWRGYFIYGSWMDHGWKRSR